MKLTRRDFIKSNAVAAAASVAGVTLPALKTANAAADDGIRWDKAACRYCGTGCSVLMGVKDGKVVASQGDPDAPVNKGLNCIKGYFLPKIQWLKITCRHGFCRGVGKVFTRWILRNSARLDALQVP